MINWDWVQMEGKVLRDPIPTSLNQYGVIDNLYDCRLRYSFLKNFT